MKPVLITWIIQFIYLTYHSYNHLLYLQIMDHTCMYYRQTLKLLLIWKSFCICPQVMTWISRSTGWLLGACNTSRQDCLLLLRIWCWLISLTRSASPTSGPKWCRCAWSPQGSAGTTWIVINKSKNIIIMSLIILINILYCSYYLCCLFYLQNRALLDTLRKLRSTGGTGHIVIFNTLAIGHTKHPNE